ncbi:fatty acid desaturase [Motilibacter peucedani]|uniref:Fatty acid desaturase n=1 Tax=Motilibacter peucedani TaxID=598650 RepID=A0A420XQL9_9ACTN|nr:acyl-CoA desaturase [Motilibacter peucedani]RKS75524.1 fatty acid desaturase [Motilibacter peucedani]
MAPSARFAVGSEYAELSRQVRAAGLLARDRGFYWRRASGCIAVFAACWAAFVLLGNSWFQLAVAAVLAAVVTQFGFLGHDGAHRQVFDSPRWNEWSARILAGAFAGLSYSWWASKHNRHHSGPNQQGKDPDIGPGVLAFTPAVAAGRSGLAAWLTRHQGWAFFPLLTLEGLHLHIASVQTLVQQKGAPHRWTELGLVTGRLAANLAVVLVLLPPGKAAAFLAVQLGLTGVFLGGSFAPNHKGMPLVPRDARIDFLRRQVLMSRNVDGGRLTDFAMGGLNYQIEHHLFPSMPRRHLRLAQPIVRRFCAEHGVAYTQTSLLSSYGIVVRYLNAVGLRARDPFTCPLVALYRA